MYLGVVMENSKAFITRSNDDMARGYSDGKGFIDFVDFYAAISNGFAGQVWSNGKKRAYSLMSFCGDIYMT